MTTIRIHSGHEIQRPEGVSKTTGRPYAPYVQFYMAGRVPLRVYNGSEGEAGLKALLETLKTHVGSGVTHLTVVAGPEADNRDEFRAYVPTFIFRPATDEERTRAEALDARVFQAEFTAVLERRLGNAENHLPKPRATEVKEASAAAPTVPSRPKATSEFPA